MHEIGVVRQVLKTVENFADENGLEKIDTIVLEIGDLSLVIPKYVEDIYNVIIKGTPFEFTKLKIEVVEGQGICRDCKRAFPGLLPPLRKAQRRRHQRQGLSCQGSHCSLSRGHFVQHL